MFHTGYRLGDHTTMGHILTGTDLCTNPIIMLVRYLGWFTALHLHIITMDSFIAIGDTTTDPTGHCMLIVHTIPGMKKIIIHQADIIIL